MAARVLILMGSDSDLPVLEETKKMLLRFEIESHMTVASAHRTPRRAMELAEGAEGRGIEVIVAGAGMAAHLAGVVAAHTILPVIGVPLDASSLSGMDALLSTVQMPPGIPVAAMAVGKAGARNAAVFAAQIISRKDPEVAQRLREFRQEMTAEVLRKAERVEKDSAESSAA